MEKEKIKHDHKCQKCGKVATKNVQNIWHSYDIDREGQFGNEDSWEGTTNEFYCDECYKEECA